MRSFKNSLVCHAQFWSATNIWNDVYLKKWSSPWLWSPNARCTGWCSWRKSLRLVHLVHWMKFVARVAVLSVRWTHMHAWCRSLNDIQNAGFTRKPYFISFSSYVSFSPLSLSSKLRVSIVEILKLQISPETRTFFQIWARGVIIFPWCMFWCGFEGVYLSSQFRTSSHILPMFFTYFRWATNFGQFI